MTAVLLLGCLFFLPRAQLFVGQSVLILRQILIRFSLSFVQKRFCGIFSTQGSIFLVVRSSRQSMFCFYILNSNFKLSRGYLDPALNNPAQGATESKKIIIIK